MPDTFEDLEKQLTMHLEFEESTKLFDTAMRQLQLNDAYREISRTLKLVTKEVTVTQPVPVNPLALIEFTKPNDAYEFHPDGVYINGIRAVSIDVPEAMDLYPNYRTEPYTDVDLCRFNNRIYYVHDVTSTTNIIPVLGVTYPFDVFYRYYALPDRMVYVAEMPWAGKYSTFNDIIPTLAASKMLEGGKGNEFLQASRFHYNRYMERMAEFKKFLDRQRSKTLRLHVGNSNIGGRYGSRY